MNENDINNSIDTNCIYDKFRIDLLKKLKDSNIKNVKHNRSISMNSCRSNKSCESKRSTKSEQLKTNRFNNKNYVNSNIMNKNNN